MLIISGQQYTRTKWFYIWLAVAALAGGIGPGILLTMMVTMRRTQEGSPKGQ